MNKYLNHNATDISFKYNVEKFEELDKFWTADNRSIGSDSSTIDLLLVLALLGVENKNKIPLDTDDGKGKIRTLSRTMHQKESTRMDSIIGLITLLSNNEESEEDVLNKIAFAKMNTHNMGFTKLPNVRTFYEFMLGGIDYLYEIIFEFGKEDGDIATSIYDYIEEKEDFYTDIFEQAIFDDIFGVEQVD